MATAVREGAVPPRIYEDFKAALAERFPALSPQLKDIGRFVLDHPVEVAFGTVAGIAGQTGTQPSSIVRFAQAIGYTGFSDMQQVFRGRLAAPSASYRERIERQRQQGAPPAERILAGFVDDGIAALRQLADEVSARDMERAIAILGAARVIYLLGQGRSFPVAYYLSYALARLERRSHLLDGVGGITHHEARCTTAADALVAISFSPYAPQVGEIVADRAAAGTPVVAITDSALSPLARLATLTFEIRNQEERPFRSLVGPICLAQTLVVGLGHFHAAHSRGGDGDV